MKKLIVLCAVSLMVSAVMPAHAKKSSTIVKHVEIEGVINVKPKAVLNKIKTKRNKPYNEDNVRADMRVILELGYFDNVEVSVDTTTLRVAFKVKEKPYIKKVSFKGNKVYSQGRLKSEITLKEKDYYDLSKFEESKSKILSLYRDKGYADVKLESLPTTDEKSNQMTLTFIVTEGNRILIGDVKVDGVKAYQTKKIAKLMKTKRKKVFKDETYESDRQEIIKFYKNNGYIQVEVPQRPEISFNKERTLMSIVVR